MGDRGSVIRLLPQRSSLLGAAAHFALRLWWAHFFGAEIEEHEAYLEGVASAGPLDVGLSEWKLHGLDHGRARS